MRRSSRITSAGSTLLLVLLSGACGGDLPPSTVDVQVDLKNREGKTMGQLALANVGDGVRFIGWAQNLPVGTHSLGVYRGHVCAEAVSGDPTKNPAADELYFGDLETRTKAPGDSKLSGEAAEIAKTVPGVSVESLTSGAGSTVLVRSRPADDAATAALACGEIGEP